MFLGDVVFLTSKDSSGCIELVACMRFLLVSFVLLVKKTVILPKKLASWASASLPQSPA